MNDEISHIHLVERASARGDRRWAAYSDDPTSPWGFGWTAVGALADFLKRGG